ncbi:MAG: hypothetical protein IK020_10375 [Clostridiales bacterium]|nr:hypothetical protein [Clostridiales bacterium]
MKRALSFILIATILTTGLCGCKKEKKVTEETKKKPSETTVISHTPIYSEVETHNRELIAKLIGVSETSHDLDYIISALKKYGAGEIQSIEYVGDPSDMIFDIIGEDGTEYRYYLTIYFRVDAVQNVTTGEMLMANIR